MARLAVIGVPSQSGGRPIGVARGPGALRAAGLIERLRARDDVADYGDIALSRPSSIRDPASGVVNPMGLSELIRLVDGKVTRALVDGRFPLVIGGDCPMLLGCLTAAARTRGRTGLLHVDGHEDAYRPEQSPTGDSADSEIAFALGIAPMTWDEELRTLQPWLEADQLVALGPRDRGDLAGHEVASIGDRVTLVDADVLAADPEQATRIGVKQLVEASPGGFWFHLDWDVLSTAVMPAVIHPAPGGLAWNELGVVAQTALADPRCVGWDAGTYNPDLDPQGEQAERIVDFLSMSLRSLDER